jgi:hypothetical protein
MGIASSGVIFSSGTSDNPAKDWIIRRNTFCKGKSNTKGNDPSHTPSNSYLHLNQHTQGLQVTDNIFMANGALPVLLASEHGVKQSSVSHNLFVGKTQDYLISLSNFGDPDLETSDIEYSQNQIIQLNPDASIYKIDYNYGNPPPTDSYRFFENTYYHYGTFHTRSILHQNESNSTLLETDLRALAIDSDQEAGSRSFNSLLTCQGVGEPTLIHNYEFPRDASAFEFQNLTVADQESYLELTVPLSLEGGSYFLSDWTQVSPETTYRVVFDFEPDLIVPGHVRVLEDRKTQSLDESLLSKWFGAYFSRQSFFHLITHKIEDGITEFRPVLHLRNLSSPQPYVAKLYGAQVFEYPGSCERNHWDDLAVMMNTANESKNVSLHESLLLR